MPINISYENFLPEDTIHISSSTLYEAAFDYGKRVKKLTHMTLNEKLHSPQLHPFRKESQTLFTRASHLAHDSRFIVDGRNVLHQYLQMLSGFAKGSGISLPDVVFLQSFADVSCQTLFVREKKTNTVNLVHIEENETDKPLMRLHKLLWQRQKRGEREDVLNNKALLTKFYRYRVNRWRTDKADYEFFAYPGLAGPGPAFGINHRTHTLIMADTLNATPADDCGLWSNAVAYMLADIGDVEKAKRFFNMLRYRDLTILGGYAIHMVQYHTSIKHFFCEFSGKAMTVNRASVFDSRIVFSQTNYPRSLTLQKTDVYNSSSVHSLTIKQAGLMVKRRTQQLASIAKLAMHPTKHFRKDIRRLRKLIASPDGDIESFENGAVLSGFSSPHESAYLVASFGTQKGEIRIGKLAPPPIVGNEYQLFYTKRQLKQQKHRDLLRLTVSALISRKLPLHVAILYSTPSKRARKTRYAESDEDTAYVAGKVVDALCSKHVQTLLVPLDESTINHIDTLKTDCVFNLVEWTGQDMPLSRKAFAHLRELNVPVTGATEKNFCETSDKITAKRQFRKFDIPTSPSQAFYTGRESISERLTFPVIVKPSREHGSVGLTRLSIATGPSELPSIVRQQLRRHNQPVLAETFIPGRELLVYLVEQNGLLRILPIEEIIFTQKDPLAIQTYESKWDKTHEDYNASRVELARLTPSEQKIIENAGRRTFQKLDFRGYARLDIRLKDGIPYLLEANANPNVYDDDDEDQIPGIAFPDFVWSVVTSALREYQNGWKI